MNDNNNEEWTIQGYQEIYEDVDDFQEYDDMVVEQERAVKEQLPEVILKFIKSAEEVSHFNAIPAGAGFLAILGNICKNFVHIPNGRNHEDVRLHFCWIQTSGTGKSTLWLFVGKVADSVWAKINENGTHPAYITTVNHPDESSEQITIRGKFDTFSVVDYTDSALVGKYYKQLNTDGDNSDAFELKRRAGLLEGNGLAHWDEFEYSGIFNQSTHQEKAIVYLNKFMNSLAGGENWVIEKSLDSMEGKLMKCFCQRSIFATTYPPKNVNEVMADKGVLQRMLLYIREVPAYKQHEMRIKQYGKAGTIEDTDTPVEEFANDLYEIYKLLQIRYMEVEMEHGDKAPLHVMQYSEDYSDAITQAYKQLINELFGTRGEVKKLASTFVSRIMITLMKVATLCSVAEAPSLPKEERFKVSSRNVRSAGLIVRQCYNTLVEWLERSLKHRKRGKGASEHSLKLSAKDTYDKMTKDSKGFVNQAVFIQEWRKEIKKSKPQAYKIFREQVNKDHNMFELQKESRSWYIKLKEGEEQ